MENNMLFVNLKSMVASLPEVQAMPKTDLPCM